MNEGIKHSLSDEELMRLYIAGDFTAFETLYQRHSGRVYAYLKSKVAAETAEDILQDVFIKLHKSRSKYNSQYPFLPWLFTIARNTLMDFYKLSETKLIRASTHSEGLLEGLEALPEISLEDTDLPQILEGLPAIQKRAIALRYLEDWTFEKIASHMNTSEGNARQLISRGLRSMRLLAKGEKNGQ